LSNEINILKVEAYLNLSSFKEYYKIMEFKIINRIANKIKITNRILTSKIHLIKIPNRLKIKIINKMVFKEIIVRMETKSIKIKIKMSPRRKNYPEMKKLKDRRFC